jgi:ribonuclease-3
MSMEQLQVRLDYQFRDRQLLERALTHPSRMGEANYQRLEFLGDAVLGLLIAEILYVLYPDIAEGELAKRQAALVRGSTLAEVADVIALGDELRLGQSELQGNGRGNASSLEDACEALIGALYLDGGLDAARSFVKTHWHERAKKMNITPRDAKTRLQEYAQARGWPLPVYEVLASDGPAHAPHFIIGVVLPGQPNITGEGGNKRLAEQNAATAMLAVLPQHPEMKG